MNLFKETETTLINNGKLWEDVVFISTCRDTFDEEYEPFEIDVDTFMEVSKNIDYDNGFGGHEINLNLKIVGEDWWLERHEYDGSENWVYKEKPSRPKNKINEAKALLLDRDLGILTNRY